MVWRVSGGRDRNNFRSMVVRDGGSRVREVVVDMVHKNSLCLVSQCHLFELKVQQMICCGPAIFESVIVLLFLETVSCCFPTSV